MLESLLARHDAPFEPRSVGQALPRVGGRLKVTGAARFTAEHRPDGLVYGLRNLPPTPDRVVEALR